MVLLYQNLVDKNNLICSILDNFHQLSEKAFQETSKKILFPKQEKKNSSTLVQAYTSME